MNVGSIGSPQSTIFTLDEILQDIVETATEELTDIEETYQSYKKQLNAELKATDRVWLEFHAGQCEQYGKPAKSILYRIVNSSIGCPENSIAAANAITILKTMKVSFSCLDLRRIQIPGADLSYAILDTANLAGANLENVNLTNASLNSTNLSKTNLKNVKFDIPNTLFHENKVLSNIVLSKKNYLISEDTAYVYFWHIPTKTCIERIPSPIEYTDYDSEIFLYDYYDKDRKIFIPDGQFIYDRKQYIDIWSVANFKYINKLKIFNQKFSFSLDGNHLITYDSYVNESHLTLWLIKKTENNLLDFNLKSKTTVPDRITNIYFSKKFPIFYCLKSKDNELDTEVCLSIWNIEELSESEVVDITNKDRQCNLNDIYRSMISRGSGSITEIFSLDILNSNNVDEELIYIAIGSSIYSINILNTNEAIRPLKHTQATKITTEIDTIFNMRILVKTFELIYICNEAICLYSIKNNQCIGKFRLLDTDLIGISISLDGENIYINHQNKIFIHSVEALKNSKYISYENDSIATCFSPDMQSIISISNSFYKQTYDIETGKLQKSNFLKKIKSHINHCLYNEILFSPNTQHILINSSKRGDDPSEPSLLDMINTENEETYLKSTKNYNDFALSNNSEYLALLYPEKTLSIYKTFPFKKCIGQFYSNHSTHRKITISTNFHETPKVALIKEQDRKIIAYSFAFEKEALKLLFQKELLIKRSEALESEVLQLMFTDNDSKLIIACKKRVITWDIEHNQYEEYEIQASCLDISRDGTLLIYYNKNNNSNHRLYLWSITQKKALIVQPLSLALAKLQTSPDNRYIIGTVGNGGIYVWKIIKNIFRLLWRTSHNLQTQRLILGDNNLDKDVEEDLIRKMGAIKL